MHRLARKQRGVRQRRGKGISYRSNIFERHDGGIRLNSAEREVKYTSKSSRVRKEEFSRRTKPS